MTVAPIYRPLQTYCCSSSSSSNQSYGDTPSPNSSCQTAIGNSQTELAFSTWFSSHDHQAISASLQDNVENNETLSKIMEELVSNLEGEKARGNSDSFPTNHSQRINQSRCSSTRFNHANSNVSSNTDNILIENTEPLSFDSDVSYSIGDSDILEKQLPAIQTTDHLAIDYNADPISAQLSDFPNKDNGHQRSPRNINDHQCDDLSFIFRSIADPSPTLNAPVISTDFIFRHIQTNKPSTDSKDNSHIPKMVASFETWPRQHW